MYPILYQKTAQGQLELQQRSGLLDQKQRRLLIMIDGRRDLELLRSLFPGEDIAAGLLYLQQHGLVAKVARNADEPLPELAGPITQAPPPPREAGPGQLLQIKQLMLTQTRLLLGDERQNRLAGELASVATLAQLEAPLEHWLMTLRRSGLRGEADGLQRQITALLAQAVTRV